MSHSARFDSQRSRFSQLMLLAWFILILVIVPLSFVMNIGWYRVFGIFLALPYYIILTISGALFLLRLAGYKNTGSGPWFLVCTSSFMATNLLWEDTGDNSGPWLFFGMYNPPSSDPIYMAAQTLSRPMLLFSIVALVVFLAKLRRELGERKEFFRNKV